MLYVDSDIQELVDQMTSATAKHKVRVWAGERKGRLQLMNFRYSSKEWKMLERIQNSNPNVDILSITALMDNEQFQEYFETHKEKYLKERANRLNVILGEGV